ncbi:MULTISPECIES: histidine kinase [Stenotrophomonas]|uniref:sensor histidine kinase n=1 Tax=Stenotrophomonas TaxID=40323 RepID=UPI00087347C4|nr:histidine kinase [Stenotrophomonas sp. BIIR7]OEY99471.1 histidine kinase [Stenotrophomonas sp. BIIR7]
MIVRLGSTSITLTRYLLLWTAVVLVFAVQHVLSDGMHGNSVPLIAHLRWSMIQWYTWAALAPLVFRLAERHPIDPTRRLRGLGRHVLASLVVTSAAMVIGALVSTLFEPSGFFEQLGYFLAQHFAIGLLAYWALFALQQALHFQAEKARREVEASRLATELAQSRLLSLKSQLQPHFLFNTLHAIITLLDEDTLSAEDMLLRLSELLRAFLEDYDGQEIPLRQELDLIELYLGIQRVRFKDRLTTRTYIAPDTLDCAVPSLLLQPLVENALRHGIGQRVGEDVVEIETRRDGDALCIEVRNRNSTLEPTPKAPAGHGIGMSNTRLRLKELYGDAAEVRLDMLWPEGVACRVRLPFRALGSLDDAPEFDAGTAPA